MSNITISTRLPIELIKLLNLVSKKTWKSKSKIFEEAFKMYHENEIKKNIINSYSNIAKDKEITNLSWTWLDDFLLSYK